MSAQVPEANGAQPAPTEAALQLRGVSLVKRGHTVLDDLDLTLRAGEFVGLIGPNGGGKSMLLRVVLGLERPTRGEVLVHGLPPRAARGLVGWVPQYARFDPTFPIRVADVVACGLLAGGERPHSRSADARVAQALARVGLSDHAARQVGRLSGGETQRLLVARALVGAPRLLLLDEPTASLDANQVGSFYELLGELSGEHTIVLVSHDVSVISHQIDSIACLNRRLVYHGKKELTRETVEELYGCPVDMLVHSHTHVVLPDHPHGECS